MNRPYSFVMVTAGRDLRRVAVTTNWFFPVRGFSGWGGSETRPYAAIISLFRA
jgi:hypothetical protein